MFFNKINHHCSFSLGFDLVRCALLFLRMKRSKPTTIIVLQWLHSFSIKPTGKRVRAKIFRTAETSSRLSLSARSSQTSQCSRNPGEGMRAQSCERNQMKQECVQESLCHAWFSKIHSLPLVESCWSFFNQHGYSTVNSTAVLPRHWVHEACLYHIHRGCYNRGAETGCKCCGEVARHVVCRKNRFVI